MKVRARRTIIVSSIFDLAPRFHHQYPANGHRNSHDDVTRKSISWRLLRPTLARIVFNEAGSAQLFVLPQTFREWHGQWYGTSTTFAFARPGFDGYPATAYVGQTARVCNSYMTISFLQIALCASMSFSSRYKPRRSASTNNRCTWCTSRIA